MLVSSDLKLKEAMLVMAHCTDPLSLPVNSDNRSLLLTFTIRSWRFKIPDYVRAKLR